MNTPAITMQTVTSSNIDAIGHHAASQTLFVRFKSGATYAYDGVSQAQHAALLTAESPTQHFNKHIKNAHSFKKQ